MHQIYWLSSGVRFDDRLRYRSGMRLETELCPGNPEHAVRSRWVRPLKLIGPMEPMSDFEWTVYGDIVVSNSVVESLRKHKIVGVEFLSTEFYTSTETPLGRESLELRVTGWGGHAATESGVREVQRCSVCGRKVFSGYTDPEKLFDIEAWDNSDFFLIWPLPRYIMITAKVRDFILDSKFTGVCVKKLTELPPVVAGTLSPGNLNDWFERDRVRMIEANEGSSL